MLTLKTIDAHAEGGAVRLVVDGFPAPGGRTMADKVEAVRRRDDRLRRVLMREPRGHAGMCGAVLTEPIAPGSHAGVIFMNSAGYQAIYGHGIIALTTIVLERGLVMPGGDESTIVFDTAAGTVRGRALRQGSRVARVTLVNVPSFVVRGGLAIRAAGRPLRADLAFGGALYAIVDSEAAGLSVDFAQLAELRRTGVEIARSIDAAQSWVHPVGDRVEGVQGTIFTAPPRRADADLRSVMVRADGHVDRSPGATGTAAVMAVLDAMQLPVGDRPFVHEGIAGTRFTGRVAARTMVGETEAIVTEIDGSAWITGEHTLLADSRDPLAEGFAI